MNGDVVTATKVISLHRQTLYVERDTMHKLGQLNLKML